VAVYPNGSAGPTPLPVAEDAKFVRHDEELCVELAKFDFSAHRLFAYGPGRVVMYSAEGEKEFLEKVLRQGVFGQESAPIRSMITRYLTEPNKPRPTKQTGGRPLPQRLRRSDNQPKSIKR
jgi:hypothetical protein